MLLLTACFTVLVLLTRSSPLSPPIQHAAPVRNLTIEPAHCTDHPYWIGNGLNRDDCDAAVNSFFYAEVSIYRHERFEFIAPFALPRTPLYGFHLPIRFRVATCVLVVASLSLFPAGSLPDGGERLFPSSDVASYWDLMHGAGSVKVHCVLSERKAGWAGEGREDALGVFLWGTGSLMDRAFGGVESGVRVIDVDDLRRNRSRAGSAVARRTVPPWAV